MVKLRNQPDGEADTLLEESSPTYVVIVNLMLLSKLNFNSLQGHPLLVQFLSKRLPQASQASHYSLLSGSTSPPQQSQTTFIATSTGSSNGLQIAKAQRRRAEIPPNLLNSPTGAHNLQPPRTHVPVTKSPKQLSSQNSQITYPPKRKAVQKRKLGEVEDEDESEIEDKPEREDESEPIYEVEAILGHKRGENVS